MDGRRLGQLSLRADAAYCGLTAACLGLFSGPLSKALAVPVWVVLVAAAATAVWALRLQAAARGAERSWLVVVLLVNAVAAVLVAGLALSRPWDALSLLLFLVALEVAAFAASQAVALRRPA